MKLLSTDGSIDYNLSDRVVKMFCGLSGIKTAEQTKEYIKKQITTADLRNREEAKSDMVLNKGDFIKGIGDTTYLGNILQNGSVAGEYLGADARSDKTPLDTDISIIPYSDEPINVQMAGLAAKYYGPIWFILRNDDRFVTTRDKDETFPITRDRSKMEVFYTGVCGEDHYGIRTGFASSEINYIMSDTDISKIGLEVAMNGFYIPVANTQGKIVFTPKDYDDLRKKMSGLSYYGENNFEFSDNLVTEDVEVLAEQIEENNKEVETKRNQINRLIKSSLDEVNLGLKTHFDGDLSEGSVELIDTGSTGRGTNKPGDGDFDFMMKLDRSILSDDRKLANLKGALLKRFGKLDNSGVIGSGDFRLKGVQIDDETFVDIDITFTNKTDKVPYSTDECIRDRLKTIEKQDPVKYKYVIANILLAKQVLKDAEAYKPARSVEGQGGLGGIGIENWILQNSGSFIDAANSFLKASEGKSFDEFKDDYQVWDFGSNHLAEKRGQYAHDNFVDNMNEQGYQKMVQALKNYLSLEEEYKVSRTR